MSIWIVALYSLGLASFLIPVAFALSVGVQYQSPLAFHFVRFNVTYGLFVGMLFAAFVLLELFPEAQLRFELFADTVFFLLYAALFLVTGRLLYDLLQQAWEGPFRRLTEVLAVAGVAAPLLIHALVYDGEATVSMLRLVLNGAYVFLFLGWLCILVIRVAAHRKAVQDPWKRGTLAGASLIVLAGIPLNLVDALWPLFQLEWHLIPRGFNFHVFFVLAWNLFFTIRWFQFPAVHQKMEQGLDPGPEALKVFTSREREIVLLILKGESNQDISRHLNIRPGTTKNHIYNIFNKTGASSRKELASMLASRS